MAPSFASDLNHIEEVKVQRRHGGLTSIYYASVIAGIILAYASAHWSHRLNHQLCLCNTSSGRYVSAWLTPLKKSLYGSQIYGLAILPDRVALACVYFGVNIGVSIWDIDWHHYTTFANRLGWVSLCNMCLAIFLALKSTPLSPIAGRSYESINVLHRWCGYTTILLMTMHTAVYVAGLYSTSYDRLLTTPGTLAADVAGIAMILILLTANGYVRRRHYEFFYIAHTTLITISLITVCYHTSKAARHSLYIALIGTSVYALDKAVRFSRFAYYLPSNTATLTPLPSANATRVTLTRSVRNAAPGSHAFLHIPSIRTFQTHPFTMVSRDPVEFVISARDGFTKALFEAACEKPGQKVRAGIEGAYGCVPGLAGYDRVVLFAGGSGATFAFALAVEWARTHDVDSKESLEFVWSVRTIAQLTGFLSEITILEAHPRIGMHVHVTKASKMQSEKSASIPSLDDTSKTSYCTAEARLKEVPVPAYAVQGRPDVHATIRRVASESTTGDRILIAACGPTGLSDNVRTAVKDCTSVVGPSLDLHLEAFGW